MNKAKLSEHRDLSRRLAKGLCPSASNQFMVVTDTLVKAWNQTKADPLPQNLLDLCKALETKLDAIPDSNA